MVNEQDDQANKESGKGKSNKKSAKKKHEKSENKGMALDLINFS